MKNIKNINARAELISPEVLGTDTDYGPAFTHKEWLDYRKKWDENPKRDIAGEVPLQIDMFAVDACNLRCPMCPRGAWDNSKKGYMSKDIVMRVIDEATNFGLEALNFGGLGEPTVHPDIIEIIDHAKKKGVTDVNIHTNGTRLNSKLSKELVESGLDRLIISLDSADKERYEKIRVGASFEKTYHDVQELIDIRDSLKRTTPHIKLNFINMDENDDTEKKKFIDYWGDRVNRIGVLRYLDFECYEESFEELYFKDNYVQDEKYCCSELWRRLSILSDGIATICTRDFNKHEEVGNIHENSITEIWTGEKMERYRDLHRRGEFKEIPICSSCPDSYYLK